MVTKIQDLANILRNVRKNYMMEYDEAVAEKEREFTILENDYKRGSNTYIEKKKQIELDFDMSIGLAMRKAANKVTDSIEELREWELQSVQVINEEALRKINLLQDIPVTETELKQLLSKNGSKNYWFQKAASLLAEKNGIPTSDLPIEASLDAKLNVIGQLSEQFDKMVKFYGSKMDSDEAAKAKNLYLNDDILQNAMRIYSNGVPEVSGADAVTRAYGKIRATSGQMEKACLIGNSLRNLKSEDTKNALLYRLSMDDSIMPEAFQIAGVEEVIKEWKSGKAVRYAEAVKMMDSLKNISDVEKIKEVLRNYNDQVSIGAKPENEFLRHEITRAYEGNSFIGKALQEMTPDEFKGLMAEAEQGADNEQ